MTTRETKTVQQISVRELQREIAIRRAAKRDARLRLAGLVYVYVGATCGVVALVMMLGGG